MVQIRVTTPLRIPAEERSRKDRAVPTISMIVGTPRRARRPSAPSAWKNSEEGVRVLTELVLQALDVERREGGCRRAGSAASESRTGRSRSGEHEEDVGTAERAENHLWPTILVLGTRPTPPLSGSATVVVGAHVRAAPLLLLRIAMTAIAELHYQAEGTIRGSVCRVSGNERIHPPRAPDALAAPADDGGSHRDREGYNPASA